MALESLLAPLRLADFENADGFRNLSPFEMLLKATEPDYQRLKQARARGAVATVAEISKQEESGSRKFRLFGHEFIIGAAKTEEIQPNDGVLVLAEESASKGKSVIADDQKDDESMRMKKRSASKRKYETPLDGVDEEWAYEKKKPCKKPRKNYSNGSCSGTKITQKRELAELPESFKNIASELGGIKTTLLFQKTLFASDIREGHGRLLMPLRQMKTPNFLLYKELQDLENRG